MLRSQVLPWVSLSLLAALLAAGSLGGCAAKIPTHNGYKTRSPWKKPKLLKLDDKSEARAEGDLDYAEQKRARWFAIDLPGDGDLEVKLEVSTGGGGDAEAQEEDDEESELDLAMEVLDGSYNVITKADAEDEDAGMQDKSRSLLALTPGRYYVHLYLQGRLDAADYELAVKFTPVAKEEETDFPAQVAFAPPLPLVPLHDDTPMVEAKPPKDDRKKPRKPRKGGKPEPGEEEEEEPAPTGGTVSAQIINVSVAGGGTQITINRGTEHGLADGRKGYVNGVKTGGSFLLTGCGARSCKAIVKASVDEVNRSGKVTIK